MSSFWRPATSLLPNCSFFFFFLLAETCWPTVVRFIETVGQMLQSIRIDYCDACAELVSSFYGLRSARWHCVVKKGRYSFSWEPHLRATGRHLPYGITQCYLPPDTSERAPPKPSHAGWYTRFTYPGGMEGWVYLVDLIAPRPGVEPATFRSRVRRRTTASLCFNPQREWTDQSKKSNYLRQSDLFNSITTD